MRWKTKESFIPDDTVATQKYFAFFPVTLNGETRWLEYVEVDCVFKNNLGDGYVRRWWPWKFTDQLIDLPADGFYVDGYVAMARRNR